jgi:Dienelactone hydrolase family
VPEVTAGSTPGYLAVPAGSGPWPGVVVIHESFGLNADIRARADRLTRGSGSSRSSANTSTKAVPGRDRVVDEPAQAIFPVGRSGAARWTMMGTGTL